MSTEQSETVSATPPQSGIKKKNLAIIALVFAGFWALAIASKSIVFMSIVGFLTLVAAGIAFWAWRFMKKQKALVGVLQGASESPEKRREALAALEADKNKDKISNVIARAQLMASDSPSDALALLNPIDIKTVPANAQDDFALLKSQLLLNFGKAKTARPLVDYINIDNPARKDTRAYTVAIVAETWARTGSAKEANKLLDSVDPNRQKDDNMRVMLLMARVQARFSAGNKGLTRSALAELGEIDPNLLGRFFASKTQTHPGLKRLARESYERMGARRTQKRGHVAVGGRKR